MHADTELKFTQCTQGKVYDRHGLPPMEPLRSRWFERWAKRSRREGRHRRHQAGAMTLSQTAMQKGRPEPKARVCRSIHANPVPAAVCESFDDCAVDQPLFPAVLDEADHMMLDGSPPQCGCPQDRSPYGSDGPLPPLGYSPSFPTPSLVSP